MAKVLVVGGGFAGVEAAIFLRKKNQDVTLISDREYMYIYPTSIWVPVGITDFDDICIPMSELSATHGFKFIKDSIKKIEAKEMKITGELGVYEGYDYIVIAVGSGKIQHKGSENFISICGKPEESLELKEAISKVVEKRVGKIAMGFGGNPNDSSAVRGGPAFEVLFNVHNMLKKEGIRNSVELTFFAPMEKPGAKMGENALKMMDIFFDKLDINKRVGKKIKEFQKDAILFEDDSKLEADVIMFIPAGKGHDFVIESDLPVSEAGFVKINDYSQVEGFEKVFAIGDTAELNGPAWRAKQGHVAEVMARNTANNITVLEGGEGEMKGYKDHLNILCVMDSGDGAAFVYRDDKRGMMIPMPFIGHWLKRGWGWYCYNSKLDKIPRIPGM
jgi:sulfide:quinone oxidoreductase